MRFHIIYEIGLGDDAFPVVFDDLEHALPNALCGESAAMNHSTTGMTTTRM